MSDEEFCRRADGLKPRLYRTALLYLGGETAAVDAVDEAVYRGLTGCAALRRPEFFSTWLTRILLNVCAAEYRRRKWEQATDALPETPQEVFDGLPLRDAVSRLPEELRAVVVLRFFSGLTLEETARVLDLPRTTVSTRQKRALALLTISDNIVTGEDLSPEDRQTTFTQMMEIALNVAVKMAEKA